MNTIRSDIAHLLSEETLSLLRRIATLLSDVEEPYLVGGFLRDIILGRTTHDIDIAFREDAIMAARQLAGVLGGAFVVLDQSRRIARVVLEDEDGTVLSQKETWHLDLASLQGDLHQDLARRDFTVDAMAVPLRTFLEDDWQNALLDPFGGRQDIERGVIRAVGPDVFKEDGIRLLRAVRLAAALGFDLDEKTRAGIRKDAAAIDSVSAERVRDELLAILAIPNAVHSVYLMDDLGLLGRLLPELEAGRSVQQPKEHYWDVFQHNVETVGAMEGLVNRTWEPPWVLEEVAWDHSLEQHFSEVVTDGHTRATLCKLTGLLHDVAKPATKTVETSGRIRFFGHQTQGAAIARSAMERLRLSRRGVQMVETMVDLHLRPGQTSQGVELPTSRAIYRYFRRAGDVALDTLYLNMADYIAARGPYLERDEWAGYAGMIRHILTAGTEQWQTAASPGLLNGRDVMDLLGLAPGPQVGQLLDMVEEARAAGEVTTREAALDLIRMRLPESQGNGTNA